MERTRGLRVERVDAALSDSLSWLCGPTAARRVLIEALVEAGRDTPPTGTGALLAFVHAHVLPMLRDVLGARDADDFLAHFTASVEDLPMSDPAHSGLQRATTPLDVDDEDVDLEAAFAAPTLAPPPPSSPSPSGVRTPIVLVCSDPLQRVWLVRLLVRAHYDVVVVEHVEDLRGLDVTPEVALVDLDTLGVGALLGGLAARLPGVRVVALSSGDEDVADALLRVYVDRYQVHGADTQGDRLVESLRAHAAG